MTKLKNTKKGMAKKALSISLVAAMLATSNVPVWAAEFTDGTDAVVEAPVVEEAVDTFSAEAEAPVEETTNTDVNLQAEESKYNVEFKDIKSEMQWGVAYKVPVKVTDPLTNKDVTDKMYYRWLDANGNDITEGDLANDDNQLASIPAINFNDVKFIGNTYILQVYEKSGDSITWTQNSTPITVTKREVSGKLNWSSPTAKDEDKTVRYTGKQITEVPEALKTLKGSNSITWDTGKEVTTDDSKMTFQNFKVTGEDVVNSSDVSKKTVKGTGEIVSDYYTGSLTVEFKIWRKAVKDVNEAVQADLAKTEYEFTGNNIIIDGKDVTITNKASGEVVKDATSGLNLGTAVAEKAATSVGVNMTTGSLANFGDATKADENFVNPTWVNLTKPASIVKRDLANTDNTKITVKTVTEDVLGFKDGKAVINVSGLKNNLTIKDVNGDSINKDNISLEFPGGKNELEVQAGGKYSVIVKGDDNFTNSRTVEFSVVAHDLNETHFEHESDFTTAVTYTGEKHTKGLTAENLVKKLGKGTKKDGKTPLSPGTDFDVNVQFGENTNAGTGQIIINGKGSYAGSQKIIEFDINPAEINKVTAPEKVLYDPANINPEDYAVEAVVTAEFEQDGKDYKLTVPAADYEVAYTFEKKGEKAGNEVGNAVKTTITYKGTNDNFVDATATPALEAETIIANKAITESDIIMDKTTYTYNGAEITPEYKVVVGGVELEKGVDYTEVVTHNVNVGEATLTVTGKGEFDTTSVSKKFNIVAADVSAVKVAADKTVVYNGKAHKDKTELSITLDGNDVSKELVAVFPTSKTANINAGNGTVTLKPVKGNKNFTGEETFTFTIAPAELNGGTIKAFDKNGTAVNFNKALRYDGTAKTFEKTTYTAPKLNAGMKFTDSDYEIRYVDNVSGKGIGSEGTATILVIATGNYQNTTNAEYECADGTKIKNVAASQTFKISRNEILEEDVIVSNDTYKGGFDVEPNVIVTYKGKELVKDKDFVLDYSNYSSQDRTQVTNGKTLDVIVKGKGGYYINWDNYGKTAKWGIDKFDFANANILVSGTDAEPVVKVMNGNVLVDAKEYILEVKDGKVTVTATADNKNYTGTQTVDIKHELEKPEMPVISGVEVVGNKATVILEGECEGATGYDFVISTNGQSSDKNRLVNKNVLGTETTFQYLQQDMYWAHCHAWKKVNGKKVFSDYSEAYPFSVTAITPDQPSVTSVKVSKNTVKVTYTKSTNATGYDLVLGKSMKKVNGEMRPVEYGKLVKKVYNGNTVTATFTKVPKGTYYVGLHAYNRTSENGKKVFSPWSNAKKVVVK